MRQNYCYSQLTEEEIEVWRAVAKTAECPPTSILKFPLSKVKVIQFLAGHFTASFVGRCGHVTELWLKGVRVTGEFSLRDVDVLALLLLLCPSFTCCLENKCHHLGPWCRAPTEGAFDWEDPRSLTLLTIIIRPGLDFFSRGKWILSSLNYFHLLSQLQYQAQWQS